MKKRKKKHVANQARSRPVDVGGSLGRIRLIVDDVPRYELRIDRDGRWFHEGVEILREDIRNLFSRNLSRTEDGGYCVRIGRDEFPVTVEDAPLVVKRVTQGAQGEKNEENLMLLLNDGTEEPLDPGTLIFKDSNIPYCMVRDGIEARFSRPSYYQLAEFIEPDSTEDRYLLVIGDETFEIGANHEEEQ